MATDLAHFELDREKTVLLVVDVQEKLVPNLPQQVYLRTLANIRFLTDCARQLGVPVMVTEQYPKGLGHTVSELKAVDDEKTFAKVSFSCCGEPSFMEHLQGLKRSQVLVTGMEAHVCVYQTVLGLLGLGLQPHLVRDAVISRGKVDYLNALELARAAGATVTTAETALFQLMRSSAIPEFKAISALLKERTP
ncbi:MAG TPA: isochorismatase family protein [Desulfuromonadales bacterium]|nr:isochorismatase family protein [Desulfuromonadales bacterium]